METMTVIEINRENYACDQMLENVAIPLPVATDSDDDADCCVGIFIPYHHSEDKCRCPE